MWNLIVGLWNTVIFEPVFNLIAFLIAIVPWHNFGLALIIFTIIIRLLLYPVIKKQLLQIKKQKDLQPEVARIKKANKANKGSKQQESLEIMSLYKENNFNPFAALGYILIQVPILIGLYQVINRVSANSQTLAEDSYSFIQDLGWIEDLAEDPEVFDPTLFGVIDLTRRTVDSPGTIYESQPLFVANSSSSGEAQLSDPPTARHDINLEGSRQDDNILFKVSSTDDVDALEYTIVSDEEDCERSGDKEDFSSVEDGQVQIAVVDSEEEDYLCVRGNGHSLFYSGAFIIVAATAITQYFTSKQMMAAASDKKKSLRQIFKEQAAGKEVDQAEISAATNKLFTYMIPILIFVLSLGWFAALPFYWFINGLIQHFQQKRINDQNGDKEIKAKVDGKDASAIVEGRLNAKEKKEQATQQPKAAGRGRAAKRISATTRTVNKKDNKEK